MKLSPLSFGPPPSNRRARRAAASIERRTSPTIERPTTVASDPVPASTSVSAVDGAFVIDIKTGGQLIRVSMSPDEGARVMAECLAAMEQLDPPPDPVVVDPELEAMLAESIAKTEGR